jgi:peptide-methionine (R)-S-oxide reductase
MSRRNFLLGASALTLTTIISTKGLGLFGFESDANASTGEFPYTLPNDEWRTKLTSEQYRVLRDHGTERAGSSPLNNEKRAGTFHCAGCDQKLFASAHKFDSGTGWPSFYQPLDNVESKLVGSSEDNTLWMKRTEVHCTNCGGHQGHVFSDGPKPTGLRYCINGVAMVFKTG